MDGQLTRPRYSELARFLLGLGVALSFGGCSGEGTPIAPVTTFDGFCVAVHSIPDSTAASPRTRHFAPDSIRRSFVHWYDSVLVSSVAYSSLGGDSVTDPVVRELRRLQMVGVWNKGSDLHVANEFWDLPADTLAEDFDGAVVEYRQLLSAQSKGSLSGIQKCIYGAMNAVFSSVTVHGADDHVVTIPTEYSLRGEENYDSVAAVHRRFFRRP